MVKLFSKNSNLCDHNPPTSQTDRQTDDMRSQDRALHWSASRGKNFWKHPSLSRLDRWSSLSLFVAWQHLSVTLLKLKWNEMNHKLTHFKKQYFFTLVLSVSDNPKHLWQAVNKVNYFILNFRHWKLTASLTSFWPLFKFYNKTAYVNVKKLLHISVSNTM